METIEYYFSNSSSNNWHSFLQWEHDRLVNQKDSRLFTRIEGYGWDIIFSLYPDGRACTIDNKGNTHVGIWFYVGNRKIGVFDSK